MKLLSLCFLLVGTSLALAQTSTTVPPATDTAPPAPGAAPSPTTVYQPGPADVPSLNHPTGQRHLLGVHAKDMKRIQDDNKIQLLFLGDSITFNWSKAPDVWKKYFGQWDAANFGDGGSYTQHLLWRITNGELDGISPKVVVLLIGINNLYHKPGNTPEDTAKGIKKIIDTIQAKCPNTKILLLGLFPYREPTSPVRTSIQTVNSIISKYDDGQKIRYLGLWNQFLQPDGTISKTIMSDGLHPTPAGYEILGSNMEPLLQEMMK